MHEDQYYPFESDIYTSAANVVYNTLAYDKLEDLSSDNRGEITEKLDESGKQLLIPHTKATQAVIENQKETS